MSERRRRTTMIYVAIPTTLKAVAELLGAHPATIGARYHRVKDAHPKCVPCLDTLAVSHKTRAHRGRYAKRK